MQRKLTPDTTLDNLRREAKRWLKALRENDPEARERFGRAYPKHTGTAVLRDVQYALAREHGFESWKELKAAVPQAAYEQAHVVSCCDQLGVDRERQSRVLLHPDPVRDVGVRVDGAEALDAGELRNVEDCHHRTFLQDDAFAASRNVELRCGVEVEAGYRIQGYAVQRVTSGIDGSPKGDHVRAGDYGQPGCQIIRTVCESFRKAFAEVATCIPRVLPFIVAVASEKVRELPFTLIPKTPFVDDVKAPVMVADEPVSRSSPWTPLAAMETPDRMALDEVCSEMPKTKLSCTLRFVAVRCAPLMAMMPSRPLRTSKLASVL